MTTPTAALKLARDALVELLAAIDNAADVNDDCKPIAWAGYVGGNGDRQAGDKLDAAIFQAAALIDALPASVLTGGSPEHMLQDQNRDLSQWLANQPGARLHATEAAAAIAAASVPNATPPAWARPLQPAAADVDPPPMMFPPPGGEEASVPSGEPAEFKTSGAGRAEVARFFSQHLRRHDFRRYITSMLAADFACALAPTLHAVMAARATTAPTVAAPEPLRVAAQAVIDRWNSPRWEWSKQGPTADIMQALADALAAPTTQEPQ